MSELIAEARVLVTPDTSTFRTLLIAETTQAAAAAAVTVPITPVFTGTGGAAAAGVAAAQAELAAATTAATGALRLEQILVSQGAVDLSRYAVATTEAAGVTDALGAAQKRTAASGATLNRSLGGLGKGAGSAAASFLGVRGATLAATGPFIAGAAGAIALGNSLRIATSFNSEIAVLGAVTGATATEMSRAADAARAFGADITLPGVTAEDAARTITEFSKAGLTLNDSIAATRGGLQLAQAANIEFADAVTLSANALNAFNLEGDQAVHVADVLANSANLAQGGIEDTALALRQAAAAAEVVGVSFEDTSALLTLLARNGLTGSDAGTSLRTAFLRLVNPSKEANKIIQSLGVNLRDAAGNVRPEVFAEFAEAQSNLAVKTQQANAAIVFGQDAFRAFGILGKEGAAGLQEVQTGLEKTGTAAEIARARMTGLAGATENLSNQMSTLGLSIGQSVTPFVTGLVRGLGTAVGGVNFLTDAIRNLVNSDFDVDTAGLEELGDRLEEINKEADHFRESGGFTPPRLVNETAEIVEQIQLIGKAVLASSASVPGFVKLFEDSVPGAAKAFSDGIITPAEESQIAVSRLGQALLNITPGKFFPGGASTLVTEAKKLADAMGQAGEDVANSFFSFFEITARRAGKQVGATLQQVTLDMVNTLPRDLAIAQAAGDEGLELSILRQQEQRQQDFLDAVLGREQTEKNVALAEKAAQNLGRTRARITAIVDANAADAQRARDDQERIAKENQRAADETFLGTQQDARARQERLVGLADETEGLQDDIRRRQALRVTLTQQIAALRQSAVDEKTKQAAIKALTAAKQATSDDINELVRTQAKNAREEREAAATAAQERAAENAALRTQIAEARDADKSVIVAFIDQEIAVAQAALRKAKAAGKGILAATLAVEELRAKKRELLKKEKDAAGEDDGLTIFDVLRQNVETFNATGGNLVTGNQPFAGPTGFTADVAQFLHRGPGATTEVVMKPGKTPIELNDDRLVNAIERLTEAVEGSSGNSSTASVRSQIGFPSFYHSRTAEQLVDARRGGV